MTGGGEEFTNSQTLDFSSSIIVLLVFPACGSGFIVGGCFSTPQSHASVSSCELTSAGNAGVLARSAESRVIRCCCGTSAARVGHHSDNNSKLQSSADSTPVLLLYGQILFFFFAYSCALIPSPSSSGLGCDVFVGFFSVVNLLFCGRC